MTATDYVLAGFLAYRLAQLVGWDRVPFGAFRWRIIRWAYGRRFDVNDPDGWGDVIENPERWDTMVDVDGIDAPRLAYVWRCWWCMSLWSGALAYVTWRWLPGVFDIAAPVAVLATVPVWATNINARISR